MDNKVRDEGRLKLALGLLGRRQTSDYTWQCHENPIVLDRLNIATSLFDDDQTNKFTELIAKHENLNMPSRACKGGSCRGCKTGQRVKCAYFKEADAVVVDRLGLTIRHKRKKEGD